MQLNNEQKELIKKIIRENEKFNDREDLLESFCAEVYKKSYLLLGSVSNIENLKNYLVKVADTSIVNVLNEIKGNKKSIELPPAQTQETNDTLRAIDTLESVRPSRKKTYETQQPQDYEIRSVKTNEESVKSIRAAGNIYADLKDPAQMVKQEPLNKNLAQRIVNIVYELHRKVPNKYYFHIFYMKYIQRKKQAQIAQKLGIAQSELSKRYYELVKLVKENF